MSVPTTRRNLNRKKTRDNSSLLRKLCQKCFEKKKNFETEHLSHFLIITAGIRKEIKLNLLLTRPELFISH